MNYINKLLDDLASEDLDLTDIRFILNDDLMCERYLHGQSHELYIYESVKELGKDQEDNETRDEDEDDESFGEFLCTTENYWKLPSGKVIWINEK